MRHVLFFFFKQKTAYEISACLVGSEMCIRDRYSVTPLARLDNMAAQLGLGGLFVKDESYRFGLNAFKVLGGSFAMARYIAQQLGRDVSEMTYEYLTSQKLRDEFGQATFFTATDGNHGRGVAWAANRLGQKAVVHMPKGSTKPRFDNIAAEGAKVTIEKVNYDDCVRMAAAEAAETPRGVVVQDTAWEGYEEIPAWIMQGYGTMASEAAEQLKEAGVDRPTPVSYTHLRAHETGRNLVCRLLLEKKKKKKTKQEIEIWKK